MRPPARAPAGPWLRAGMVGLLAPLLAGVSYGKLTWDRAPFQAPPAQCAAVGVNFQYPDGGAYTAGGVSAVLMSDNAGVELMDSTCGSPIVGVSPNNQGYAAFRARSVDGGSAYARLSVEVLTTGWLVPPPLPVQFGTTTPTQVRIVPMNPSAPAGTCVNATAQLVDGSGGLAISSTATVVQVSMPASGPRIYAGSACLKSAGGDGGSAQSDYRVPVWGAEAALSFAGSTPGVYIASLGSDGVSGTSTTTFNITSGSTAPAYATYATAPQTVAAGGCSQAVGIKLHDTAGNVTPASSTFDVTLDESSGRLRFYSDPGCATPLPTNLARPYVRFAAGTSGGIYFFSGQGAGQYLVSLSPGNAPASLHTETIVAGEASQLFFAAPIDGGVAGLPLSPNPIRVHARDIYGNETILDGSVTVSLQNGQGGNTLLGLTTAPFDQVARAASFADLAVRDPGAGLQLRASFQSAGGVSNLFDVVEPPAAGVQASLSSSTAFACDPIIVRLQALDGGAGAAPPLVTVCSDATSQAYVTFSSLGAVDAGQRCSSGLLPGTGEVKFKSSRLEETVLTVSAPRVLPQSLPARWIAGPPSARRTELLLSGGTQTVLSPNQRAALELSARDVCGIPTGLEPGDVSLTAGGPQLAIAPLSARGDGGLAGEVTLVSCDGMPDAGLRITGTLGGVAIGQTPEGPGFVTVFGDCALPGPLAELTLTAGTGAAPFGARVSAQVTVAPLGDPGTQLLLRLEGEGLELLVDRERHARHERSLTLAGPEAVSVDAVLTGEIGTTATLIASVLDPLGRTAAEPRAVTIAIDAGRVDLGCSAGLGTVVPWGLFALAAVTFRVRRRPR